MDEALTPLQAFEAMRRFLAQFNEREPPERKETIDQILRWTELWADGGTVDPAQLHDWTDAVRSVIDEAPVAERSLRATYDRTANAAYVYLTGEPLTPGRETVLVDAPEGVAAFVAMHWKEGRIVGLEVLDARRLLHEDLIDNAEQLT